MTTTSDERIKNNVCPICLNTPTSMQPAANQPASYDVTCPRCGTLSFDESTVAAANKFANKYRWKLCSWVRHNAQNSLITGEVIESLDPINEPSLLTKAHIALRYFADRSSMGTHFETSLPNFFNPISKENPNREYFKNDLGPLTWSKDSAALRFLIDNVLDTELQWIVQQAPNALKHRITPKGWLALEGNLNTPSHIGFCAMWFDEEVKPLWTDCIEPAIRNAGYEPLRIDGLQHNNKIDDEIIASIKRAKFVIADLTGNRGGVYYEAGFAHGLGLPVIFMCRKSDDDNPHFDIRQFNTIFWSNDESILKNKPELSKTAVTEALQRRIEKTIGRGTYVQPASANSQS